MHASRETKTIIGRKRTMKTIQAITLAAATAAAAATIAAPAANATGDDSLGTTGDSIFGTALTAPLAASSSSQDVPATFSVRSARDEYVSSGATRRAAGLVCRT